jgi:hypothetical protein
MRTRLGLTCPYCKAEPDMPCEERERGPVTLVCLFDQELELEEPQTA